MYLLDLFIRQWTLRLLPCFVHCNSAAVNVRVRVSFCVPFKPEKVRDTGAESWSEDLVSKGHCFPEVSTGTCLSLGLLGKWKLQYKQLPAAGQTCLEGGDASDAAPTLQRAGAERKRGRRPSAFGDGAEAGAVPGWSSSGSSFQGPTLRGCTPRLASPWDICKDNIQEAVSMKPLSDSRWRADCTRVPCGISQSPSPSPVDFSGPEPLNSSQTELQLSLVASP